jgi:hypothetical protein
VYAERWSPGLRQGDVLGPLPLPLMGTEFLIVAQTRSLIGPEVGRFSVTIPADEVHVAVISHDCEFNEDKRNKLLLARLQRVQGNLTAEEREDLRASNDVEARAAAGHDIVSVDAFVLPPLPGSFNEEMVVNFATITALPMKMADDLRSRKRAELVQETRVLFRKKLAWFFGRAAEDIPDDEKVDPPPPSEVR